ncbi:MAG: hypothetical protein JNL79_12795 [Myxococcales bacterium]|nr:hypothetical protein [Myxococcales bacterium]
MLVPCSACRRHVRSEERCPFCGGRPSVRHGEAGQTTRRLGGIVALAAAAGAIVSACSAYGTPPLPEGPYRPHDAGDAGNTAETLDADGGP